ncbi:uncharacterized protein N7518_000139 [Penicillium psychrosexuale]|uniref:uncharacterized protein n=1 Tax=Penicillium psychrosexuale TaxID=1002107 RepID=UPI0025453272|nr:uncharacterized protein N7518_000139 [Penicillium psychrosexuale]KAJ5803836.1 hypothetical protein N7518_000139 [Penicillium psychrosexuale]
MTKEVFVFSDNADALNRIRGDLAYEPESDVAIQLETIARHSEKLHRLGVSIELHLNPGHSGVPGNEAADKIAKKAMYELRMRTETSCLGRP